MAELRITNLSSLNFRHDWKLPFQIQECYSQIFLISDEIRVQYTITKDLVSSITFRLTEAYLGEIPVPAAHLVSETDDHLTYDIVFHASDGGCYAFEFLNEGDTVASSLFNAFESLEDTVLFRCRNHKNDHETVFTEGNYFFFRVEGAFLPQEMSHQAESNDFRDQRYDLHLLSSSPYKKETLTVGGRYGIPEWAADKVNRILSCTEVYINGKSYVRSDGAAPSINVLGAAYPLYTYKIEVENNDTGETVLDLTKHKKLYGLHNGVMTPIVNESGQQIYS